MPVHIERELTFAVKPDWTLPALDSVLPEGGRVHQQQHVLEASYRDTATESLRALGITLRRRTGGYDAGWHLKVPSGNSRVEAQSRSRRSTPPKALVDNVRGVSGGQELSEVAALSTRRTAVQLLDADGTLVLEVADDSVHGLSAGSSDPVLWREVEVELGPAGTEDDLEAVSKLLIEAGAQGRGTVRKLDRVLGPLSETGSDALSTYLREQCRAALLGELGLRQEVDVDGVHDTRVAIRRVRSTLRLFADLLEPDAVAMDDELRWLAGLLSDVRDADVLRAHLHTKVGTLPPELVLGPVRDELDQTIGHDRDGALRRWRQARDSERYLRVTALLGDWSMRPPLRRPLSRKQLATAGAKILDGARKKARKRVRRAGDDPELTHRARKAVKRLRYAGDLLEADVPGAKKRAKRAKKAQKLLGTHQDLVVEASFLRHQAGRVGAPAGHNGFTYGLLFERAEHEAATIRATHVRL